jgi:hypothetical protein
MQNQSIKKIINQARGYMNLNFLLIGDGKFFI